MGLTRKITSGFTGGIVDFKSDKERTASYTKAAAKEAKKQTKIMREAAKTQGGAATLRNAKVSGPLTSRLARAAGAEAPGQTETPDLADQLTKLAALHEQGVLSAGEFDAAKAKLLAE